MDMERGPDWLRNAGQTPSLKELLVSALPDKKECVDGWVHALAAPDVCVQNVEDVKRLDEADIPSLPVPPLVKGVFRQLIEKETSRADEEQRILEATKSRARTFLAPLRDRNMQPPVGGSKYFQDLKSYRLVMTKEEIEAGVRIVARRIETWCKGERIVLVAILKGAFMFLSDLCRTLIRPYSVFFIEASSYKAGKTQGSVDIADISVDKFRDTTTGEKSKVVLLDELLDNGKTMQEIKLFFMSKLAASHNENDFLTACLFSKERARTCPEADITGIPNLPDLWLVGYGLDDRGTKRGWTELFAIPKVKIVETLDKEEVDKMLSTLDSQAMLKSPIIFAGFEFTFNQKLRFRLTGIDVHGAFDVHDNQAVAPTNLSSTDVGVKINSKADVEKLLSSLNVVKGRYEQELKFAFIQENVTLVPEDSIFSGDNQEYAKMRFRIRQHLITQASRFGVEGPGDVVCDADASP
jgi:hypoxanthine phosphoribosyltransferase